MHADQRHQVEAIAAAILAHLESNPLAADSVDGVARWWLGAAHPNATVEQAQSALDWLVSRGALRCLKLTDGTVLYSQPPPTWQ